MPKHLPKILLIIFLLTTGVLRAQIIPPLPKYTSVETADNFLSDINYHKFLKIPFADSVILQIDSVSQLQRVIAIGAKNRIVGVEISVIGRPNLEDIFNCLTQFPYLRELRISDRMVAFEQDKPYRLPANIQALKHLKSLSLNNTNKMDMDDALNKLLLTQNLYKLEIYGYYRQLSPVVLKLKQIKNISLSAENIGDNDLSKAKWESLSFMGDSYRLGQDGYKTKYLHDVKAVAALRKIKTLKSLDLHLWGPMDSIDVSQLRQITELNFNAFTWSDKSIIQIGRLTRLKKLTIDNLGWHATSIAALSSLTRLTSLKLSFSEGAKNPHLDGTNAIAQLRNLESLDISHASFDLPDNVFNNKPKLKHISFRNDGIHNLPSGLFNLPALEYLYLATNNVAELLDVSRYGCTNLKYLWLDNNKLTYLPEAITYLPKLEGFSASGNSISMVAGNYGNLKALKDIDISVNRLEQYPNGLASNQSIQTVSLKDNAIKVVPEPETGEYRLKSLALSDNPIALLPKHIDRYKKLAELSLENGKLIEIPEALGYCDSLNYLNLNRGIAAKSTLPASLQNLKNLSELELSDDSLINHQSIFEFVFATQNPHLTVTLTKDNITKLPADKRWSNVQLHYLNLSQNHLTNLPEEFAGINADVFLLANNLPIEPVLLYKTAVNKADLKVWFEELHVPFNFTVSNRDYASSLLQSVPYFYENHKWSKVVEFADRARAADLDFYQSRMFVGIGVSRYFMKDYEGALRDLNFIKGYQYPASDYRAKAFLALGKLDSAAVTYASTRILSYYIKADSICQISGNKALANKLKDSLASAYQHAMAYNASHEYFNDDELVYAPKNTYHYSLLIEYAMFKLMNHGPNEALDILNKKVISGWDLSAKALLTATANYLIDPKTYAEDEQSLKAMVQKRGKIKYYGFVPITDWLPYSDYTADQKEHLTALQQIAYN